MYAIRNIVAEAKRVEAAGTQVRYLNIGDPITFGFKTPPHLVEAVSARCRRSQRRLVGIAAAREAVADECARRGMPLGRSRHPDVRNIRGTAGATAPRGGGDGSSSRSRRIRLAPRCRRNRRARGVLPHGSSRGWLDLDHIRSPITLATRALVAIDPNNPTGAVYPPGCARAVDSPKSTAPPADEVRGSAFDGPEGDRGAQPDAPVITFSSLSKVGPRPDGGRLDGCLRTER